LSFSASYARAVKHVGQGSELAAERGLQYLRSKIIRHLWNSYCRATLIGGFLFLDSYLVVGACPSIMS